MSAVKEVRALTGLRGFAAVYVVFYHYFAGIPMKGAANILLAHGYLAVDLFFVLSGFVMTLNYTELFHNGCNWSSFTRFLGRRIARVYPLYLVATTCAALLLALGLEHPPVSIRLLPSVVLNLGMVQTWGLAYSLDSPGWSISAEWAAYLLFPLCLFLALNASAWKARLALLVSVVSLIVLAFISPWFLKLSRPDAPFDIFAPYRAGPLLRCLPEFFIGVFIARLMVQGGARLLYTRRYVGETIAVATVLLLCVVNSDLLVVLLVPFLILSLTSESNLANRFLSSRPMHHFGLLSYSIYLMHELLAPLIRWIHRSLNAHGFKHAQTLAAVPALVLSYLLALAAFHLIEKPGRRILRNLFEGDRRVAWVSAPAPTVTSAQVPVLE